MLRNRGVDQVGSLCAAGLSLLFSQLYAENGFSCVAAQFKSWHCHSCGFRDCENTCGPAPLGSLIWLFTVWSTRILCRSGGVLPCSGIMTLWWETRCDVMARRP